MKSEPDPPPSFMDDEHPLADAYRLIMIMTREEARFPLQQQARAEHLMRRAMDIVIPEEKAGEV